MKNLTNSFSLDKLDARSQWVNKRLSDLSTDARKRFFGHRIAVRYLNTDNDAEIRDLFTRLNKFLTPLKPQELRNATYQGPFVRMVTTYADNEYWAENRVVTAEAIRRMGDIEFVSELFIGLLHGPQGGSADIINDYYAQFEDFEDEFPNQKTVCKLFDATLDIIKKVLVDIKEIRWSNKTDFYSLFVAIGTLLKSATLRPKNVRLLKEQLIEFGESVDEFQADEDANVDENVKEYAQALVRGANDKSRRFDRHAALTGAIASLFTLKKKT